MKTPISRGGPYLNGANIIAAIGFSVLIVLATRYFIAPHFAYFGYIPREWSLLDLAQWVCVSGMLGYVNYRRWIYPSHAAFTFLLATIGLPIASIPVFWGTLDRAHIFLLQVTTICVFLILRVCLLGSRTGIRLLKVPPHLFWTVAVIVTIVSIGYLTFSTGISPGLLSVSDVYAQRDEYSENVTTIGSYLLGWLGAGILPALVAWGLYQRNRLLMIGGGVAILALYSVSGNKSYAVGMMLTGAAYYLCARRRSQGHRWLTALGLFVTLSALLDFILGGFAFTTLIVRRALSTAGLNTAYYFDFFGNNPHYELRHSIFSFLGQPPYSLSPPKLIGLHFYGNSDVVANANLVADGYANFGIAGCFAMAVVVGLYLRMYDKGSLHLPLQVSAPSMTLVLVAMANSAPLTVLSTHGGLVMLLVMLTMPAISGESPPQKSLDSGDRARLSAAAGVATLSTREEMYGGQT